MKGTFFGKFSENVWKRKNVKVADFNDGEKHIKLQNKVTFHSVFRNYGEVTYCQESMMKNVNST